MPAAVSSDVDCALGPYTAHRTPQTAAIIAMLGVRNRFTPTQRINSLLVSRIDYWPRVLSRDRGI
jgi:hypothetical protein